MLNKAYVHLERLKKNARAIKARLKKDQKFCAVVKADAYGHGAPVVANALHSLCDCFAVAIVEEGVELRLSGITKDILVLIPPSKENVSRAVAFNLTISVDNLKMIEWIESQSKAQNKITKVQIKYNTGMNRLGVDGLRALNQMAKKISDSKWLYLDGLFSHFACPENKNERILAENKFLLANNLVKGYNNKAICHISASGGFLVGAKSDMIRAGILLYGYKPFPSTAVSVRPVMKIYAPLIEKRKIKAGESALYGVCRAESDLELSLVRYGYADGLNRINIESQFNNRCMDVSALYNCKATKRGVLIMDNADELAKKYQTISYEILTKSALRAEKIYLN